LVIAKALQQSHHNAVSAEISLARLPVADLRPVQEMLGIQVGILVDAGLLPGVLCSKPARIGRDLAVQNNKGRRGGRPLLLV
jgi:hypothetical protein